MGAMFMKAIEIKNLTKSYGKHRGIIDINLTVEEGDFFGFIGPNGAGKSTLIRNLLGLITKSSGDAKILGMDIGHSKKEILANIGYLPSETEYYPGMKVKDVLKFSAKLHGKDCSNEARKLCEILELDVNRKVDELSLGNRKKVGIICAMQHKPKLYIMDEPTSGLDPLMQKAFYNLLKERNKEGATIFLSSHILSEVQDYCIHAAVIREGRLLVSDTVENLGGAGAKKVVLHGFDTPPKLPEISGIKGFEVIGNTVEFYFNGNPNGLLKSIADVPLKDVNISEPDLNEVFMHYYEGEAK